MNATLTRLANSLTEAKLIDLIREGIRERVKDLTKNANVDEIVKVSCETKKGRPESSSHLPVKPVKRFVN